MFGLSGLLSDVVPIEDLYHSGDWSGKSIAAACTAITILSTGLSKYEEYCISGHKGLESKGSSR